MRTLPFLLLFLFLLSPVSLYAEYRIATVDVNKVLNESEEAKEIKKDLDKLSMDAKKKLESKRKVLQEKEEKLSSGKIKADSKEADSFRAEAREFTRMVKDTEEELKRKFLQTNKKLADKSLNIITSYAKEHKIDLILDKSVGGRGPVLFRTPTIDITDDIVALINK